LIIGISVTEKVTQCNLYGYGILCGVRCLPIGNVNVTIYQ